jgi:uncharacterized damage-inducible protein DinB
MKMTDVLLAELNREGDRSRRALEQVPQGKYDWKPHDRSMIFGYLAHMVATMPSWLAMAVTQDELDLKPAAGSQHSRPRLDTSAELVAALDKSLDEGRSALQKATDDFLKTPWRLLVAGKIVSETSRELMIEDTLNHWIHHRGQMTVYLRLMGAKVPALYGPSADEQRFD